MAMLAFALPLTPGRTEEWQQFCAEMAGPRRAAYQESRRRLGFTGERGFLQRTPTGDFAIIVLESDDFPQSLEGIGRSQEPFDVWFRQRAEALFSGIDLSQPLPAPLSELVFDVLGG
ncbi:MAG: hypothetical protein ACYDAR_22120 [Thermomicrobiales bacterium]